MRAFLLLWIVLTAGRVALPATGWRAQYFGTDAWSGPILRERLDGELSTDQLRRGWDYTPPDVFSATFRGHLYVSDPGEYEFVLASDDGSTLYVDRRLVVENRGAHARLARSGRVRLPRGSHAVLVEYSQHGGPYALEWTWARDGGPARPVPVWRVSPEPRGPAALWLAWIVRALWPPVTLLGVLAGVALAVRRGWWPSRAASEAPRLLERADIGRAAACLALYVALAAAHTWPLVTAPGLLSRNDNADTVLNEWAMAWVAHQWPRDPAHLFDANIFHPETGTLALSEPLIVQGVMATPLLAAGASPVLAYNLVLLAGFVLTAWSTCLVVRAWTGDWLAGLVAGSVLAFNAHTLTRLPHIQAQHAECLPLALFALDGLLRRPRWATAVLLAVSVALQAAASIYLFVFLVTALLVAVVVRPEDWRGPLAAPLLGRLLAAAALAAVALLPLLLPYLTWRSRGLVRSLDEAAWFAASARDYLTTPSRWYAWAGGDTALFPGAVAVCLALVALATGVALRDARARMCLAFGAAGVLLSFGPAVVPGYETMHAVVPLLQAVRATSRFGYLGLVAVAVLAGYGVHALRRRLEPRRALALGVAVSVTLAAAIEPLAAPLSFEPFAGIPALYRTLAAEPGAVVVELPFPRPESIYVNAQAMLHATVHWRPLLNGYSGFTPPGYVERYLALHDFPSDPSMAALRRAGVTHVVVHEAALDTAGRERLAARSELQPIARDGSTALFALR